MAKTSNIANNLWFVGQDTSLQFDVVNAAGTAQTMTGWALEFILRDQEDDAEVLKKTVAGGGITIGNGSGTNDRATVVILRADTLALVPGAYDYALWRTDASNSVVLALGTAVLAAVPRQ